MLDLNAHIQKFYTHTHTHRPLALQICTIHTNRDNDNIIPIRNTHTVHINMIIHIKTSYKTVMFQNVCFHIVLNRVIVWYTHMLMLII